VKQRDARVRYGAKGGLRGRFLQDIKRLSISKIGQVGVAIDQAGQYPHVGQIDDLHALGNLKILADGLDLGAPDQNDLVRERAPGHDVDELAGADDRQRRGGRRLLRGASRG